MLTTRDYRLFDIQHAVLPTRLPLDRFYEELVKTQAVINRKHLGAGVALAAAKLMVRQAAHGQTNFLRMLWKFNSVYNARRQYDEHFREMRYQLPLPAGDAPTPAARDLYIHQRPRAST
jgi:magnesium-protoporphyrin IX monomethyl ester (oxidative) cyclase